jgi:hypothetical protein
VAEEFPELRETERDAAAMRQLRELGGDDAVRDRLCLPGLDQRIQMTPYPRDSPSRSPMSPAVIGPASSNSWTIAPRVWRSLAGRIFTTPS